MTSSDITPRLSKLSSNESDDESYFEGFEDSLHIPAKADKFLGKTEYLRGGFSLDMEALNSTAWEM